MIQLKDDFFFWLLLGFFFFFLEQSSDLVPDGQLRNILNKSSILPVKGLLSNLAPPPPQGFTTLHN